jgi:hypothetical protein
MRTVQRIVGCLRRVSRQGRDEDRRNTSPDQVRHGVAQSLSGRSSGQLFTFSTHQHSPLQDCHSLFTCVLFLEDPRGRFMCRGHHNPQPFLSTPAILTQMHQINQNNANVSLRLVLLYVSLYPLTCGEKILLRICRPVW